MLLCQPSSVYAPRRLMRPCTCAGTLPAAWASNGNLTQVNLANNTLSGNLPPQWAALHELKSLNLSFNLFQGPLPSEWRVSSTGNGTIDRGMTSLQNMCAILPYLHASLQGTRARACNPAVSLMCRTSFQHASCQFSCRAQPPGNVNVLSCWHARRVIAAAGWLARERCGSHNCSAALDTARG